MSTSGEYCDGYGFTRQLMTFILFSWAIHWLIVVSIGCLGCFFLARLSSAFDWREFDLFQTFWIGVAFIVAAAQIANVFTPLDSTVLIVVIASALPGLILLLRFLVSHWTSRRTDTGALCFLAVKLVIVLSIALIAAGHLATESPEVDYDTGLYHFSWVRWANESAVVPGLANLHSRLGFNSGLLTYSALFDNLLWDLKTAWLTQGFLIWVVLSQLSWSVLSDISANRNRTFLLFIVVMLPYLLGTLTDLTPGLQYDTIPMLLQVVLFAEFIRHAHLLRGPVQQWIERLRFFPVVAAALAAMSFVFKPSGAIAMLMTAAFCGVLCVFAARHMRTFSSFLRFAGAMSFLPVVLLSGWMIRNVIVSGWLFFPFPAGRVNVEWAVPTYPLQETHAYELQSVAGLYETIKYWARVPGPEYRRVKSEGLSFWVPRWFGAHKRYILLLPLGAVLNAFLWFQFWRNRKIFSLYPFLSLFASLNVLFFFLSAPDTRYGEAFVRLFIALPVSVLYGDVETKRFNRLPLVILLLYVGLSSVRKLPRLRPSPYLSLFRVGTATARETKTVRLRADDGHVLEVLAPVGDDRCGDSPLPCTPYPLEGLRSIQPDNLKGGFVHSQPAH